jgi:NAD+ synthase
MGTAMTPPQTFSRKVLVIDPGQETAKICGRMRELLARLFRRRGYVVAVSGGIDSSVTLALAAKAVGPARVLALLMPETHSAPETLDLSRLVADHFKVPHHHENISVVLEAVGFYDRYAKAVRRVIPGYDREWKSKIVLPSILEHEGFRLFSVVAQKPDGTQVKGRLSLDAYLEIVAATNFKQRTRKMLEYYHADRLNYAVAGTPNRLEYDQGFFVKLGDGAADMKPIAHLYKTQVYQLAEYLGVPEEVRTRRPTTDTYSLPQGQDEFYFSLPFDEMDLCLYGKNNGVGSEVVAKAIGLPPDQVERVYADIVAKRSATRYLHLPPLLACEVPEIDVHGAEPGGTS